MGAARAATARRELSAGEQGLLQTRRRSEPQGLVFEEEELDEVESDVEVDDLEDEDVDDESPEKTEASPALARRRAQRRVALLRREIAALRRLICGGWMAQWRMLCELGEDPVPCATTQHSEDDSSDDADSSNADYESAVRAARREGEAAPVSRREEEEDDDGDVPDVVQRVVRGSARVDPTALAGRFAADIAALDAATAQLAGLSPARASERRQSSPLELDTADAQPQAANAAAAAREREQAARLADAARAPYAAALAETLLKMERASGCLRALAAIDVAPFTPSQLREQLDTAYARLEDSRTHTP